MYDVIKVAIALSCLLYASYHDIKTRLIPPWIWWLMGIPALIFYGIEAYGKNPGLLIMLIPLGAVMIEALIERDDLRNLGETWPFFLMYLAAFGALLWGYMNFREEPLYLGALSATAISVLFFVLYSANIIHGAADAKALVMLSILFPAYPFIRPENHVMQTLSILFPFSLTVLLFASLTVALMPLYFLILNLSRHDVKFPEMLLGYRMDLKKAREKKVWPMAVVENGKVKRMLMPAKYMEIDWDALEEAGMERLWVTPKIPFIVPITIGFVLAIIIGNPVLLF